MRNAASAEEEGAGTNAGDDGAAGVVVEDEDEEGRVVLVRVLSRLPGRPRMKMWSRTV